MASEQRGKRFRFGNFGVQRFSFRNGVQSFSFGFFWSPTL